MTPDFILPRAIRPDEHPVDYFWELLEQLRDDDYPAGVLRVPGRQPGTWAFSSGAGLIWRAGTPRPAFPAGGVMFVGNNLNAFDSWMQNRGRWGDPGQHAMLFWKNALSLMARSAVPTSEAFFTNAHVGLIEGNNPTSRFPGRGDLSFGEGCAAFLIEQIQVMQPRLVVALGDEAKRALDIWNIAGRARMEGKIVKLLHPSARRISEAERESDAATLRAAYSRADPSRS